METAGGRDVESRNDVVITLKKRSPEARWPSLGKVEQPVKRPLLSVRGCLPAPPAAVLTALFWSRAPLASATAALYHRGGQCIYDNADMAMPVLRVRAAAHEAQVDRREAPGDRVG